jgi:predicted outer membrane protein
MAKPSIASTALALALAGSSGGMALAQQANAPQVTPAGEISAEDQEFLTQAIQAGVAEVQSSPC